MKKESRNSEIAGL